MYAVAVHQPFALSGGGNDQAFVWRLDTGEQVRALPKHGDSVVSVGFSADGRYAASGGMDGRVHVADMQQQATDESAALSLEGPEEVTVGRTHW